MTKPMLLVIKNGLTPQEERDIMALSDEARKGENVTKAMTPKEAIDYLLVIDED